jgi:hypothetical protein
MKTKTTSDGRVWVQREGLTGWFPVTGKTPPKEEDLVEDFEEAIKEKMARNPSLSRSQVVIELTIKYPLVAERYFKELRKRG